jgi:D-alanine-D-alanine ligase
MESICRERKRGFLQLILVKSFTDKPWRSPETYDLIEEGLSQRWPVESIIPQNPQQLNAFIADMGPKGNGSVFVFNIAEYIDEETKQGFLPALFEEWGIPHLGSSAAAITRSLNKASTKEALEQNGIPTPRYFVVQEGDTEFLQQAEQIGYPLIVKPLMEGGHIGIREDSVVADDAGLEAIVNRVLETHHQPALVEEFLTGAEMREFSVGVIAGEPALFTPIEIDYQAMEVDRKILSYEAAQKDLERTKPVAEAELRAEIIDLATRTFEAVGADDYSRVDLRADASGCYVLEINAMPGLGPHSFLPAAAEEIHGLDYAQLVQKLAADSIDRQFP